jgi:hypothetical protein
VGTILGLLIENSSGWKTCVCVELDNSCIATDFGTERSIPFFPFRRPQPIRMEWNRKTSLPD